MMRRLFHQLKNHLSEKTISNLPNYDKFDIFAQGHDFLIYHDFYKIWNQNKLDRNVNNSILLQESNFSEFVYQYLNSAKENDALDDEVIRLFIGPGYIMHHLLDAYTHPQIIYYSGDHTRDTSRSTWMHGIVENLIDIYMMKEYENKDSKKYKVYKDFVVDDKQISSDLIEVLNDSLEKTYQINNGGNTFKIAFNQTSLFMKTLKYDSIGLKKKIFDYLDPKLKGTSSFSYHREPEDVLPFLNLEHNEWLNPLDGSISSKESFIDLYNKAIDEGSYIIDQLESICQRGIIQRNDIYDLVPNISSTHGLECGKKLVINNIKKW